MNFYAVQYSYIRDADALNAHRPAHREFLNGLVPEVLVVAGAYQDGDEPGALLIVRADTSEDAGSALDPDPFNVQQLISGRTIRLWNPGIGSLGA